MAIQYLGNKQKFAKSLLQKILPGNEGRLYYEPFVGSAAFLVEVPISMNRFANDKNPFIVAMHEAVRDGWIPPTNVSAEEYESMQRAPAKYPPYLIGFVSFGLSHGGKMWKGYAKANKWHPKGYAIHAHNSVLKTVPFLQGVTFSVGNYHDMQIPNGALVYCDPPYGRTTGYKFTTDTGVSFKKWCEELVSRGCQVYISGYKHNKMSDWDIVWSQETRTQLGGWTSRTEVLFQHNSQSGIIHPVVEVENPTDCCPVCGSTEKSVTLEKCNGFQYDGWHGDL